MKIYNNWKIFTSFFKVGVFTFGGGMAMLPLLEEELKKYQLSQGEILHVFSLASSMPGMLATNIASIMGRKLNNIGGSICATIGVILPSYIIILAIFFQLHFLLTNHIIQGTLGAIRSGASVLILFSATNLVKKIIDKKNTIEVFINTTIVISIVCFSFFTRFNPIVFIICAVLFSTLEYTFHKIKN